ncbi:ABC transporter permease [Arenibaculum sp.]|uniref:MlaE family ABC transporter permease n=1 Tax=Arenibaculum sp. TaxID=2865862 RepID=UPI002E14D96D|nr:ABC transporter permease [Arenibaculum sp.]
MRDGGAGAGGVLAVRPAAGGEGGGGRVVEARGRWLLRDAEAIERAAAALRLAPGGAGGGSGGGSGGGGGPVRAVDAAGIEVMDTAGAVLLLRLARMLGGPGAPAAIVGLSPGHEPLMAAARAADPGPPPAPERPHVLLAMVERTGRATATALGEARDLLAFFGLVVLTLMRTLASPRRLRVTALLSQIEKTGWNALPIVGLLSFLIGVVLAYQGADQLAQFGAQLFVVDLLGISILREIGILMTAIIVAGRSGSAFTAQIGTMKVNQEVDALRTLGLDPIEVLVLPRALALVIALPLLAFYANVVALAGGAVMSRFVLDIPFGLFLIQLRDAIDIPILLVGLSKAPVFALVIALVGCYEGLKVSGSAESVGRLTTQSVVVSIFLVIVLDAVFSVFFSLIGV